jgi:hypothetical protein
LSEAEYHAAMKHCHVPASDDLWCKPGGARVHMLSGPEPVAVVCLDCPDATAISVAGLFAHEAMHIWQDWLRDTGEDAPGDEVSAYAVQSLVVLLMGEWASRRAAE